MQAIEIADIPWNLYVTSDTVRPRGVAFILGAFVLGLMWASFALDILFGI
jgi:hypothetical protein